MQVSRRWKRILVGAVALVALAAGGAFTWMQLVKAGVLRYNKWDRRSRGTLEAGAPAPDLTLAGYDGRPVKLGELWDEKPVVLVFGSCT